MARANLNFNEPDHSFVAVSSANVGSEGQWSCTRQVMP